MNNKYFTIAEANSLLPVITKELESLQKIKREFEDKYEQLQQLKKVNHIHLQHEDGELYTTENRVFTLECEIEFMQIEANALIQSVHLKGAQLKDIDRGLIDFPAIISGAEVLLCWKQGEERITYYHGLHEGFAGRKPIEE